MKLTELKQAKDTRTHVAFAPYGGRDSDYALEVVILNEKAPRRVYSGARYDWGGHKGEGVLIEHVGNGKQETVHQSKLVAAWADYVTARAARQQRQRETEQRQTMSKDAAEQAAKNLKDRLAAYGYKAAYNAVEVEGVGGGRYGSTYRSPYAYAVRVAPEILEKLLAGDFA